MIAVLCGGVGAARLMRAMSALVAPSSLTAIVNTGDDEVICGLSISPDLDSVCYTLADRNDTERGWGLANETWNAFASLRSFEPTAWFQLGDNDLGLHLFRTEMLGRGQSLSAVTASIAKALGLSQTIIPMTDSKVATVLETEVGTLGFQNYFVGHQHNVVVSSVSFNGAQDAVPAPFVIDSILEAERVVIAPSNPFLSIGPMLAIDEIATALKKQRSRAIAISPIVRGQALKGPAARLMVELGHDPSALGVARLYSQFAATIIIDSSDAHLAPAIEALGMQCIVTDAVIADPVLGGPLAEAVLSVPVA